MQNFKTIFQDEVPVTIDKEIVSCKTSKNKRTTVPYELHHVFVMMIAYHKKQPNTIIALRNTDKLLGISIAYGSRLLWIYRSSVHNVYSNQTKAHRQF